MRRVVSAALPHVAKCPWQSPSRCFFRHAEEPGRVARDGGQPVLQAAKVIESILEVTPAPMEENIEVVKASHDDVPDTSSRDHLSCSK